MKIFNILIVILSTIVIYIVLKNHYNKKIENFTVICTASLTDWEKKTSIPSGKKLTNLKWNTLKTKLSESNNNIVSFSFKNDLFSDMNNVLDYTIDINDYLEIDKNGSKEYWKPIKKWKEGVVSHFCKELCVLKLGYEWIKTDNITNLIELSNDIGVNKTNGIKQFIQLSINISPLSQPDYAKLNTAEFDSIIGSSYINDNNYIDIDGIYYKVAANIPIGRKWKVYPASGSYVTSETDAILDNITDSNVIHFNDLIASVNVGDTIILTERNYNSFFSGINLTEKYVIHPGRQGKCFKPELFEYDRCYQKSCAVFANKEFDDYLKLINLRESMGYKTSSFGHTTDIMKNSDNKLLNLVNQLQDKINDRPTRGNCSYSLMIDKLIEVIKIGEYVRQDDSTSDKCTKTYDPYTYVKKPTRGSKISYNDICNDLDVKEYRKKINPEIYKYITTEWIDKDENTNYNFEKKWDVIKGDIDLTQKYGNDSLKDKVISKNQLSELILKYLDDVEYLMHENHRKPTCFWDGYCDGTGIIIENPNTKQFMDSKNNKLDENDIIEVYTNKNSHYWKEVSATEVSTTSNIKDLPEKLGIQLLYGTREFNETIWKGLKIVNNIIRYDIYKYDGKYYQYFGLLPRYIKMGKVAQDKYIEITSDNIENIGKKPDSTNITKTQCNDIVINKINLNKTDKLDKITELTNTYYDNLLNVERENINTLKQEINVINTDITSTHDSLCSKYDSSDYKLYTKYNLIKFTKNTSLNITDKDTIDLNGLTQKTIKLKEINTNQKNKKFNKHTSELLDKCKPNECRDFGNITDENNINILEENTNENIIIISLNDFSRIINNKVNILENDYILVNTTKLYKIFEIYHDNIIDKIDNDFSKESYPDIFKYTYDDFISINIDLHKIDINSKYYIIISDNNYELIMDNTFKKFITNYKSIYQQMTDINLTNTEKCINNEGELLFADNDAIIKGTNSCTGDNICKENIFEKKYNKIQYENIKKLDDNKKSWSGNELLPQYNDMYKEAVGHDIEVTQQNNTHSNFWKNKYHNEIQCPTYGTGKQIQVNDLYNVNPVNDYGLKWKKLSSDIDTSGKTIIEIYDYDVLNTSLDSNEIIIDFTNSQNNIRFKNIEGNIINMSYITKNYYLMITYIGNDGNEFNNYYEVFSTNKCSSSQICSSKSNQTYIDDFNKHVQNIYSDQEYCNNLNTKYTDRYTPSQKTSFEQGNTFKINNSTNLESLVYYPNNYDDNYNLYEFSNVEQISSPE